MAHQRTLSGVVHSFDDDAGLGVVRTESGDHPFHCTAIVDGTRSIEPGTAVTLRVVPGRLGTWEATAVTPRDRPECRL